MVSCGALGTHAVGACALAGMIIDKGSETDKAKTNKVTLRFMAAKYSRG
jgi:hypothetical protein